MVELIGIYGLMIVLTAYLFCVIKSKDREIQKLKRKPAIEELRFTSPKIKLYTPDVKYQMMGNN